MKTLIIIALMFTAVISNAQKVTTTYAIENGKVVEKVNVSAAKAPDPVVYTSKDGIKFYKGAKGGIYYWKASAKTGKLYKHYVK